MAESAEQVDRIVREVLSRLDRRSGGATSADMTASHGEIVITEKVVSAATLIDRLAGVKRVLVSPRAVVTPSARDLLRDKNITLVRALKPSLGRGAEKLILYATSGRLDIDSLISALRQRGIEIEPRVSAELAQAVVGLAGDLGESGTRGVLLTGEIVAALCLANRRRGVRAAAVANRGDVNEAIRSVGANLLVIDSMRRSKFEIERIVEAFAAMSATDCPEQWKQFLD